ncbi:MAG: hypothetical protein WBP44_05240 [Gammaproteobacteria bacterium]|jgi:hypothetical protein
MSQTPCRPRAVWLSGVIACLLLLQTPLSQAQEGYGKSTDPVAAEALGKPIRTSNPGEMAYVIKQVLSVNYAREHDLQATDAEIKDFVAMKKELDARARKDAQARQSEIEKSLQAENLPDTDREQLEGELKFLQQMQEAAGEADKQADTQERMAGETQMARAIIGQWKVNKALYKQYGGRVIYQRGGAEPLDAYEKFFKEAQKAGDVKFINEEFETAFWNYYATDSRHKFYPENEKDQAINTPWW